MSILLLAWIAYFPGLSGTFLFDDFVNLPSIGATGPIDNAGTLLRYLTSGTADPTGRPLALLTFLADARDWPAEPGPFLRTNLILHLCNGTLLFLLLKRLGAFLGKADAANTAAAITGAGCWLLHPLFVSTTLYIVQREAMLPATFMLLGFLAYSRGRRLFNESYGQFGLATMVAGLVFGTLLATLSKANGVLFPLLCWVLEATILSKRDGDLPNHAKQRLHLFHWALIRVPGLIVLTDLALRLRFWNHEPMMRGWTIGQRMITEPRVLLDYLQLLVVPRSVSTGLYNDGYTVSRSLLQPPETLAAILILLILVSVAFLLRTRTPRLAAAISFFLVGHLLESTVIPLELYFEHRNYLPALLFFWPLAHAIFQLKRPRTVRTAIALVCLGILALTTNQRATIWGQPDKLAAIWAASNVSSSRAQATAAANETASGKPYLAMQRLLPIWKAKPGDLQIALNYVNASCSSGELSAVDAKRLENSLRTARVGTLLVSEWLQKALFVAVEERCPGITIEIVESWIGAAQQNPAINTSVAKEKSIPPILAQVALEKGDSKKALKLFNQALLANISPETAAGQASLLATHGYYVEALAHLDFYEALEKPPISHQRGMPYLHELVLDSQNYWPRELSILRAKLRSEIEVNQRQGIPGE